MKRKLIIFFIWLLFTVLYVFNFTDIGRSMGAQTNSAIENYVEYNIKEYTGAEGAADSIANSWSYSYFNDLEKSFKFDYKVISVTTVIYIIITISCYHLSFVKKENMKSSQNKQIKQRNYKPLFYFNFIS